MMREEIVFDNKVKALVGGKKTVYWIGLSMVIVLVSGMVFGAVPIMHGVLGIAGFSALMAQHKRRIEMVDTRDSKLYYEDESIVIENTNVECKGKFGNKNEKIIIDINTIQRMVFFERTKLLGIECYPYKKTESKADVNLVEEIDLRIEKKIGVVPIYLKRYMKEKIISSIEM